MASEFDILAQLKAIEKSQQEIGAQAGHDVPNRFLVGDVVKIKKNKNFENFEKF